MSTIYDLDNAGGGHIIAPFGDSAPALSINSHAVDQAAISILSTASGAPIKVSVLNSSIDIDSVAASTVPCLDIRSGATTVGAVNIGRTVNGGITVAALRFLGTSVASAALMRFDGGFISCTSITLTSVAYADYALPVALNGQIRYIPLFQAAAIQGGAAF